MFGHRFFGARYFGPRYFGPRVPTVSASATEVAVAGGHTRRHRRRRVPVFDFGGEIVSAPTIHLRLSAREADDTLHATCILGASPKARQRRRTLALLALQ